MAAAQMTDKDYTASLIGGFADFRIPLTEVELLLKTGKTDLDSRDTWYGWTPLFWAVEKRHGVVVKLLRDAAM